MNRDEMTKRLRFARVGQTLYVFQDETRADIDKEIRRAMERGETRYHRDGTREFIDTVPVFDASKEGSSRYTWDKSGNRVKYLRYRVTVHPNGETEREKIGTCWKAL